MSRHRRMMLLATIGILAVVVGGAPAEAGSGFELRFGRGGVGVSVAYGDWGVYTAAWSQPSWSFSYDAALAGYGEWVWVSGLGRVWRPWVKSGWQPYTYGRWVTTSYGWTWVAYEPWGYFPHHYGNWALTSFGWVWAPGYTYHAAGVVWVRSGSYVGWYAAPPRGWCHADHGFRAGYNRGYDDGYVRGYDDGWRDARYATYVPWKHFGSENVSHYQVAHSVASRGRVEALGRPPSAREVRDHGGASFVETRLDTRSAQVGGHRVLLARPVGVAGSVERHASETVRGTLSPAALNARQWTERVQQSGSSPSGRQQLSNRSDQGTRARQDADRSLARARSSSQTAGRSDARAPRAESWGGDSRVAPRAPQATSRQLEIRRPAATVPSRVSQEAAPRTSVGIQSRAASNRSPVRTARPATRDSRGYTSGQSPTKKVGTSGRSRSEAAPADAGSRRSPSHKNATSSENTKYRSSNDRSPRRTVARKR